MSWVFFLLALAWGLSVFTVVMGLPNRPGTMTGSKTRVTSWRVRLLTLGIKQRLMFLALLGVIAGVQLALGVGLLWWLIPWWLLRKKAATRAVQIEAAMPEMVELLTVALYGGLGLEQACRAVAARIGGPLSQELALCMTQVDRGIRFDEALSDFKERTGGSYRGVVDAVLATQRYGLPLASTLERLGAEAKAERRRQSEARTRRLPVQMLFPLVLLFLPSVLLVVVVPVVGAAISQLTSVA